MVTRNLLRQLSQYTILLGLVSSCTVYAPMQPTVSTITAQGQSEITASIQPNGRVEGNVQYSPLPHTVVMVGGTFRPRLNDSTFLKTRQWEAGLGTYWSLGRRWTVTGLAGYGYATTHRSYHEFDILGSSPGLTDYKSRYHKVFGQVGFTKESDRRYLGLVYRVARLNIDQLNYTPDYLPFTLELPIKQMTRHEALFFYRHDLDAQQKWQVQFTTGLSVDMAAKDLATRPDNEIDDKRARTPVLMTSLGVVFRPKFLSQH